MAMLSTAWAQERTVTGKVTSAEDGSPLPGVNVLVKGTTAGTVTDINGAYSVAVPSTGGVLVFSFIGLKSSEIEIGERSVVDVALALDVQQLSEVVVTAFGVEQEKKALWPGIQAGGSTAGQPGRAKSDPGGTGFRHPAGDAAALEGTTGR